MEPMSLGTQFYESFECPICYDYFKPPIIQCPNGHSFCNICAKKSVNCAICRSTISQNSRNIVLEHILDQIKIGCKFKGCEEILTLATKQDHYKVCPFNHSIRCIECHSSEDDLMQHLITQHNYKEIEMEACGGKRSFSGPYESWIHDTNWPKGIWKFGNFPILVHAKTKHGIFHMHLFTLAKEPIKVTLEIDNPDSSILFRALIPHISDFDKPTEPHFNVDVSMLQSKFLTDDENCDIFKLWMNVKLKQLVLT